jgi:hypothetical protein
MIDFRAFAKRMETDTWVQIPLLCASMLIAVVLCGLHLYWVALASMLVVACVVYIIIFAATEGKWLKSTHYALLPFDKRKEILRQSIQFSVVTNTNETHCDENKTYTTIEDVIKTCEHNSLLSWTCYFRQNMMTKKITTMTEIGNKEQNIDYASGLLVVYCGGSLPVDNPALSLMNPQRRFTHGFFSDSSSTSFSSSASNHSRQEGVRLGLSLDLNVPLISFDWPTSSWDSINFGQKDDCWILTYAMKSIRAAFPNRKIIMITSQLGVCRVLNWWSRSVHIRRDVEHSIEQIMVCNPIFSHQHYIKMQATSASAKAWLFKITRLLLRNYKDVDEKRYSFVFQKKTTENNKKTRMKVPILYVGVGGDPNRVSDLTLLKEHFHYVSDLSVEFLYDSMDPLLQSRRFRMYMAKRC